MRTTVPVPSCAPRAASGRARADSGENSPPDRSTSPRRAASAGDPPRRHSGHRVVGVRAVSCLPLFGGQNSGKIEIMMI